MEIIAPTKPTNKHLSRRFIELPSSFITIISVIEKIAKLIRMYLIKIGIWGCSTLSLFRIHCTYASATVLATTPN